MRNLFISISLLLFSFDGITQGTLETIFYKLPEEYALYFDIPKRKEEVEVMKQNAAKGDMTGTVLDEKNGFLRWIGYQCAYELCYWKNYLADTSGISQKNLVAVIFGCQDKPDFLIEENGAFTEINFQVFDDFDAHHFFKSGTKSSAMNPYLTYFSFTLPRRGYNVTAHYGGAYGEKDGSELLAGDKIDFIWKDNSFTIGKPYF